MTNLDKKQKFYETEYAIKQFKNFYSKKLLKFNSLETVLFILEYVY